MAITKAEGVRLGAAFLNALADKLEDSATPDVITKEEWIGIAQEVAVKAFAEFAD